MKPPLPMTKILKKNFSELLVAVDWQDLLLQGRLYEFESLLFDKIMSLYNSIAGHFIEQISEHSKFHQVQRNKASNLGLKKLETRTASVQLRTGKTIKYESLYAKQKPFNYSGSRHMSHVHWDIMKGASPIYASITCLLSVICPSFEMSKSILRLLGIQTSCSKVRDVALALGQRCLDERSHIQIDQDESLVGKKVQIAIDGGRTLTREYTDEFTKKGNEKFDAKWREPKMFVITTLDKDGKRDKDNLPLYDCTFGDDEMMELLKKNLIKLQIDKADKVQITADGAPWIWNRVTPMLLSLGVKMDKITETLDYYHAAEHLHELRDYIPKEGRETVFEKLKDCLWKGNIKRLGTLLQKNIPDLDLEDFRPYQYFQKNNHRIDYQYLRMHGSPCGSGVIESAIRRIINLRFKSPSSFWYPDNVEKLILMRAIALSGRWKIMLKNLFQNMAS